MFTPNARGWGLPRPLVFPLQADEVPFSLDFALGEIEQARDLAIEKKTGGSSLRHFVLMSCLPFSFHRRARGIWIFFEDEAVDWDDGFGKRWLTAVGSTGMIFFNPRRPGHARRPRSAAPGSS